MADSRGTRRKPIDELQTKLNEAIKQLHELQDEDTNNVDTDVRADSIFNKIADAEAAVRRAASETSEALEKVANSLSSANRDASILCNTILGRQAQRYVQEQDDRRYRLYFERVFVKRDSLLSEMLNHTPDYRTMYNICVAVMVWMGVNMVITEWLEHSILLDASLLSWSFSALDVVFWHWFSMFVGSFFVIPLVQAIHSFKIPIIVWLPIYIVWQSLYWILVPISVWNAAMPPASALIVMCEQARFGMKMHAYLREKLLYGDTIGEEYANFIPDWAIKQGVQLKHVRRPIITIGDGSTEIGRYLYFLFAPTLIYRDEYPRSGQDVNWMRALAHLLNLILSVLYVFLLYKTFCIPEFRESAINPGNYGMFVKSVFRSMVPGMILLILMFFGLLHSWFNVWAEFLRFGDRRFYEDWWNVTNWGAYYRKWNAVVHEWLRHYVYFDLIRFSKGRFHKGVTMAVVFVFSAIVHEIIIACSMGFFYPILLLMFGGPGIFFIRLTKWNHAINNVFMWAMLSIGTALLMVLYSTEWYARHVPNERTIEILRDQPFGIMTGYIPHSWLVLAH